MQGTVDAWVYYSFALVKAAILAKVILIGRLIRLSRVFDERPLVIPTSYKVVFFFAFAVVCEVAEHLIIGWIHGKDIAQVAAEIASVGGRELAARLMVLFAAFIPLFAFTEIGRRLGEGQMTRLFFGARHKGVREQ
jgi:hypothetical protein